MLTFRKFLCLFGIIFMFAPKCSAVAKFTNIQCLNIDQNFTEFTRCRLHAIKRDYIELNIRTKILTMPKQKISMRWQLLKKASGYKPFLYDITLPDVCEYLEKRNHPFINIIFNSFNNRITGFHRCPLENELGLENFSFPVKSLDLIPLPHGEYALYATFSFGGKERAMLKVFFLLAEF